MILQKIYCSSCMRRGFSPTLLGKVEKADGVLRLWCKSCKKEIKVTIRDGRIETEAITTE